MQALGPALAASGFFDFCLEVPGCGIHELMRLGEYLYSRRLRDGALVKKCEQTLRELSQKEDSYEATGENFSRLFQVLGRLDVKLEEELIEFGANFFRQNQQQNPFCGRDLLFFLNAMVLQGVFPHDLIHALFSNKDYMRVENGEMRGLEFNRMESS